MTVTRADIERAIAECRLTSCLECGRCTAACPLSEMFGDVPYGRTPRGIIEMALLDADLVTGEAIWHCLTCDVCTKGCPSGVRFRDFIEALRELALAEGRDAHVCRCRRCGAYLLPNVIQAYLVAALKDGDAAPEYLSLCLRCRVREFSGRVKEGLPGGLRLSPVAGAGPRDPGPLRGRRTAA
jgi:Fe-S oxidoreductase